MTVQEIQSRFPNPKSADDETTPDDYCVGGAFCLNLRDGQDLLCQDEHFPSNGYLASKLTEANPHLTTEQSFIYAARITELNDAWDFPGAWDVLDRALQQTVS